MQIFRNKNLLIDENGELCCLESAMEQTKKISKTKKNIRVAKFAILVLIFSFYSLSAIAAINPEINYQGKLTDSSNQAVADNTYNIEFKLYTVSSGGTAIWTETRTGVDKVQVTSGIFSVLLGQVSSLSGVDFNQTLYLGVNIGGSGSTPSWDGEMSPRKKIGAVPAAFVAEKTLNIIGGTAGTLPYQSAADTTSFTAAGTIGQILTSNGSGAPSWIDQGALATRWSSLTDPTGNLALAMAAYTTTLTWNAATSTNNLFNLTDTASNTGTGYLLNVTTASGSTLKPFHVSAAGVEAIAVNASGNVGIGTTAPGASYKLDVSGLVNASRYIGGSSGGVSSPTFQLPYAAGMYSPSANAIGFTNGSAETMRILSSGYVGIGTTAPSRVLEVYHATDNIPIVAHSGDAGSYLQTQDNTGSVLWGNIGTLGVIADSSGNAKIAIDTNLGNLGIQTTSPTANFQVAQSTTGVGTVSTTATLTTVTGVGTQFTNTFKVGDTITVNAETRTIASIASDTSLTTDAWTGTNSGAAYTLTGGDRFSVLGNGNVGIGTTAPGKLLDVNGEGRFAGTLNMYGNYAINWNAGNASINNPSATGRGSAYELAFSTYNGSALTEKMTINSAGNVGIGTATFVSDIGGGEIPLLSVANPSDSTQIVGVGYSNTWGKGYIYAADQSTGWKDLVLNPTLGNVGIGTTNLTYKLEVLGDARLNVGHSLTVGDYGQSLYFSTDASPFDVSAVRMREHSTNIYGLEFQTYSGTLTTKMTILGGGNVGIGDETPLALFTVGSGDLFQVNSSGAIAASTGVTTSGQITSTVTTGTAPLVVTSSTLVTNLNADLLDGHDSTYFQTALTDPVTGTGVNGYNAYWTGTNTIAGEQYVALTRGGTGTSLTASNGGIVYSTDTTLAILSGVATANRVLLSGSTLSPAPTWSTATYPASTSANEILYSSSANTVTGLTTAGSSLLITDAVGVPSLGTDIPTAVTIGGNYIYRAGGTDIPVSDGGTGASTFTKGVLVSPGTTTAFTTIAGTDNYIPKWTSSGYLSTTSLIYDNGTNIGIGTTAPGAKLHIAGTSPGILLGDAGLARIYTSGTDMILNTGTSSLSIYDSANTANLLNVTNGGNVGIGTATFVSDLGGGEIPKLTVANPSDSTKVVGVGYSNTWDSGYIYAVDQSTSFKNLIINPTLGNVGIGTTNLTYKLEVLGDARLNVGHSLTVGDYGQSLYFSTDASPFDVSAIRMREHSTDKYGLEFQTYNLAGGGLTTKMTVLGTGNVGIGDDSPIALFTVGSGDLFQVNSSGAIAASTGVTTSGQITSTVTTGTAPLVVASSTLVTNLNADLLDGHDTSYFQVALTNPVTGTGTTNYLSKFTGTSTIGNSLVYDNGSGVGIGNTNPQKTFDVTGDIGVSGEIWKGNTSGYLVGVTDGSNNGLYWDSASSVLSLAVNSDTGTLAIDNSKQVGIGTATPSSKLDITTNALGTTQTTSSGLALVSITDAAAGSQQISPAIRWTGHGWKTDATASSQAVEFRSYVTPVQGTANPSGYLSFGSAINGGAYNDSQFILSSSGNLGIGTTAPAYLLDAQADNAGDLAAVGLTNTNNTGTSTVLIDFNHIGSDAVVNTAGEILVGKDQQWSATVGSRDSYMAFSTRLDNVLTEQMRITSSGNVGIGTTAPNRELEISSSVPNIMLDENDASVDNKLWEFWANGGIFHGSATTDTLNTYDWVTVTRSGSSISRTVFPTGNVGIGTTAPASLLSVGSGDKFQVDSNGDIVKINNVAYTWPATQAGGSGYVLTNDGTGSLSWGASSGLTVNWNSLQNPTGNLSLSMNAYATSFTWGNATSTSNLFSLQDTISNTGTGYLLNVATASGSTVNPLHVSAAGNEAITVLANGYVGLGTTNPGVKLDIYDPSASASSQIRLQHNGYDTYDFRRASGGGLEIYNVTDNRQEMKFENGNIGIGTVTPIGALDVYGTDKYAYLGGVTTGRVLEAGVDSSGYAVINGKLGRGSTLTPTDLTLQATAGNVGVGTLTPTALFQVKQTTTGIGTVSNTASGTTVTGSGTQFTNTFKVGDTITANGETHTISAIASDTSLTTDAWTGANSAVAYTLVGGDRFSVLGNGNVGIGTTSPSNNLHVSSTANNSGINWVLGLMNPGNHQTAAVGTGLKFYNVDTTRWVGITSVNEGDYSHYMGMAFYTDAADSIIERMRITNAGNVGIGTTTPGRKLDVNGDANINGLVLGTNIVGGGSINVASDYGVVTRGKAGTIGDFALTQSNGTIVLYNKVGTNDVIMNGNVGIGTTNPGAKLEIGSGQIFVPNGSAAIPSYSFTNDPDTGIYGDGSNNIGFASQGLSSMNIGRNGIDVFRALALWGVPIAGVNDYLVLQDHPSGNYGIDLKTYTGGSYNTKVRLTNFGNLGIGTTSPTANLQVAQGTAGVGTVSTTATLTTVTGVGTQFTNTFKVGDTITVNAETRTIASISSNTSLTTDAWTGTNSGVAYTLTGGTRFSVLGNGNVGIGTTSPGTNLDVSAGGLSPTINSQWKLVVRGTASGDTVTRVGIYGGNTTGSAELNFGDVDDPDIGGISYSNSANSMTFRVNNANPVIIDSSGNVGIRTTSPRGLLDIATDGGIARIGTTYGLLSLGPTSPIMIGGSRTEMALTHNTLAPILHFINNQNSTSSIVGEIMGFNQGTKITQLDMVSDGATNSGRYDFYTTSVGTASVKMTILSGGNVGIGTVSPAYKLDVNGTLNVNGVASLSNDLNVFGSSAQLFTSTNEISFGYLDQTDTYEGKINVKSYYNGAGYYRNLGIYNGKGGQIAMFQGSTGNVGIGTTSPGYVLDVQGATGNLQVKSTGANNAQINLVPNNTSTQASTITARTDGRLDINTYGNGELTLKAGNVGIGTTSPGEKLEVAQGNILLTSPAGSSAGVYIKDLSGNSIAELRDASGVDDEGWLRLYNNATTESVRFVAGTGNSWINNGGNFGIGTTSPTANFQVAQSTTGVGTVSTTATLTTITGVGTQFTNTFKVGDTITVNAETRTIASIASDTSLTTDAWTGTNSGAAYTLTGGTRFSVLGNGNVGIGTTAPSGKLHLSDSGASYSIIERTGITRLWGYSINSAGSLLYQTGTTYGGLTGSAPVFGIDTSGNVGIGTTSPGTALQIGGTGALSIGTIPATEGKIRLPYASNIQFRNQANTADYVGLGVGTFVDDGFLEVGENADLNGLKFYPGSAVAMTILKTSGNVGIGTTAPIAKLDVSQAGGSSGTNTALGLRAGNTLSYSGNNQIVFGYDQSLSYAHDIKTRHNSAAATGNAIDFYLWNHGVDSAGTIGTKQVMTLEGSGNVGIGTTVPGYKLDVIGDTTPVQMRIRASGTYGGIFQEVYRDAAAGNYFDTSYGRGTLSVPSSVVNGDTLFRLKAQAYATTTTKDAGAVKIVVDGATINDTSMPGAITFETTPSGSVTLAERMRINNAGNVGIGTTNPANFKLQVAGSIGPDANDTYDLGSDTYRWANAYLGPDTLHIGTSTSDEGYVSYTTATNVLNMQSTGNIALQPTSGNVGIGVTNPGASTKLQVAGAGLFTGSAGTFPYDPQDGSPAGVRIGYFASSDYGFIQSMETGVGYKNLILQQASGNVGIGITNPTYRLEAVGDMRLGVGAGLTNDYGSSLWFGVDANPWNVAGIRMKEHTTDNYGLEFQTYDTSGATGLATRMTILGGGNIGIGNTNPVSRLVVKGIDAVSTHSALNVTDSADNSLLFVRNDGNIGMGTDTPTNILSLSGTAARTIWMERNTTAATAGQGLTLSSGGAYTGGTDLAGGDLNLKAGISTGTGTSAMHFFTATAGSTGTSDNAPTEKMTILGSGYVGIGNTAPGSALDVAGTIRLSGATSGYVGLAPATAAGSTTYTLPSADGSSGQALTTDGAGVLAWGNLNQLVENFTAGENLTAGDIVQYINGEAKKTLGNPGSNSYGSPKAFSTTPSTVTTTRAATLDSTHFVVAYIAGSKGTAVIGTVSGTSISYAIPTTFYASSPNDLFVTALDSSHFVIAYTDASMWGQAIVGSVSAGVITFGSPSSFYGSTSYYISATALDSSHFVVSYVDSSYAGYAIVGAVSGTTITSYGGSSNFSGGASYTAIYYTSVTKLDSSHFVAAWRNYSNNYGYAVIGAVSGTTISSYGSSSTFNSGTTSYISTATLDSTHFVVAYANGTSDTAIVAATSGTTISSWGSANVFATGTTNGNISVSMLDSTHFVVTYRDGSGYGTAIIGLVSGTTISSYGAANSFNPSVSSNYIYNTALDSTHFAVIYEDVSLSYSGSVVGVVSGTTISSYGSTYPILTPAAALHISAAALDSTHFVLSYRDASGYGNAIIGSVSNGEITYGSANTFYVGTTTYISVATLDSSHFVVSYFDATNGLGKAIVGLVSGTTISSYGSANTFYNGSPSETSVAALDSTHFVVAYKNASTYGVAVVGVVSGTTISSFGSSNTFLGSAVSYVSASVLDSTHFIIAYRDGSTGYGNAIIGLVSGTTISSYGSASVFYTGTTAYISTVTLDSTHFVVAYSNSSNYGSSVIGTTSGTSISSYGSAVDFTSSATTFISIAKIDSSNFLISYVNGSYGRAITGSIQGTTITYGTETVVTNYNPSYSTVASLDSNTNLVAFSDGSTNNTSVINIANVTGRFIGIVKNTTSSGSSVPVVISGVAGNLSSLTAGATYYIDSDGALSTTPSSYKVGLAISSTEILVNGNSNSTDQYFGDMVFANSFRITEDWYNPLGLIFKNQLGMDILKLDENGNITIPGKLSAKGLNIDQDKLVVTDKGNIGLGTTNPFYRMDIRGNSGNVQDMVFIGSGLNDATAGGIYAGLDSGEVTYTVTIDSIGDPNTGTPDTFSWKKNNGTETAGVAITGVEQQLADGVTITFNAMTGHTLGDQWKITVTPTGLFAVENTQGIKSLFIKEDGNVNIGTDISSTAKLNVLGSSRFTGADTSTLSGTIDPANSTDVIGVGTKFTSELAIGDRITISGETRTVVAIISDTELTVDTAFSDNALDSAPGKLPSIFAVRTFSGSISAIINDQGYLGLGTASPSTILDIASVDLGDGAAGPVITLGINNNATNSGAGSINFLNKDGGFGYVWQDVAGNLRISNTAPTSADDTSGMVVGSQTSTRETKQDIEDYTDYEAALQKILDAPLHTFRYIREVNGYGTDSPLAKAHIGFIADEVDPAFMSGNSIDQVSINGLLMGAVKQLSYQMQDLVEKQVAFVASFGDYASSFFKDVLVKVENGVAYMRGLAVETFTIGSPDKPTGITLYDETNGSPYCFSIVNGQTHTLLGECSTPAAPDPSQLAAGSVSSGNVDVPTITLNGDQLVMLDVGATYTEAGALATDTVDGQVAVVISGTVDTSASGTYTLTYSATNTAGYTSTETRTVVVGDTTSTTTTPTTTTTDTSGTTTTDTTSGTTTTPTTDTSTTTPISTTDTTTSTTTSPTTDTSTSTSTTPTDTTTSTTTPTTTDTSTTTTTTDTTTTTTPTSTTTDTSTSTSTTPTDTSTTTTTTPTTTTTDTTTTTTPTSSTTTTATT